MSEPIFSSHQRAEPGRQLTGLFTPPVCAIAAFTIAAISLMGQNLLLVGVQAVLGQGFQRMSMPDQQTYYLVWGVSALVPIAVAGALALMALRGSTADWQAYLARAALIVAGVAAVGAVLTALGGLVHSPF